MHSRNSVGAALFFGARRKKKSVLDMGAPAVQPVHVRASAAEYVNTPKALHPRRAVAPLASQRLAQAIADTALRLDQIRAGPSGVSFRRSA